MDRGSFCQISLKYGCSLSPSFFILLPEAPATPSATLGEAEQAWAEEPGPGGGCEAGRREK